MFVLLLIQRISTEENSLVIRSSMPARAHSARTNGSLGVQFMDEATLDTCESHVYLALLWLFVLSSRHQQAPDAHLHDELSGLRVLLLSEWMNSLC